MDRLFYFLTNLSGTGAYAIIFFILLACGIGLPLPEDIPLVASGYLIWDGTFSPALTFLVTMAGVLIGDSMLFLMGFKFGFRFLNPWKKKKSLFNPKRVQRAQEYFDKYGEKIVFFARFVVGFRGVVFFSAGAMKMKYTRFLVLDALAALVSVPLWILLGYLLGYYFGNEIADILNKLKEIKHIVTGVILASALIATGRFFIKYRRQAKALKRNAIDGRTAS